MNSDIFDATLEPAERFNSLEVTATAAYHMAALARAMSRARSREAPTAAGPDAVRLYGPQGEASGDGWVRYKWRAWWVPPALWRDDLCLENGETGVMIVRADAALTYMPTLRTLYTNGPLAPGSREPVVPPAAMQFPQIADRIAEFPLTRPPLPSSEWELTTLGQMEHLGRVARLVHATRRTGAAAAEESARSGYWRGIDEYEYLIDDILQILLRLTGLVDGLPVAVVAADDIRVDAPLSADTFAFAPPPGTRIVHVGRIN